MYLFSFCLGTRVLHWKNNELWVQHGCTGIVAGFGTIKTRTTTRTPEWGPGSTSIGAFSCDMVYKLYTIIIINSILTHTKSVPSLSIKINQSINTINTTTLSQLCANFSDHHQQADWASSHSLEDSQAALHAEGEEVFAAPSPRARGQKLKNRVSSQITPPLSPPPGRVQ